MSKPELKVFNNLVLQARDEMARLRDAVLEHSADRIAPSGDSYMYDWFDGNMFAMARHLDISLKAPFDRMDDEDSFSLVENFKKPLKEPSDKQSFELVRSSSLDLF